MVQSIVRYPISPVIAFAGFALIACQSENPEAARSAAADLRAHHLKSVMPTPELSPQEVVKIQLRALKDNDEEDNGIRKVFEFASPENKTSTGPADAFVQMIKNPRYRSMLNYQTDELAPMIVNENMAEQKVVLMGADGKSASFVFHLSKQSQGAHAGCWMTDAVVREDSPPGETFAAEQRTERLDRLFELLKKTSDPSQREAVETMIWDLWIDSGDSEINSLMARGTDAMARRDYTKAISLFTRIITQKPEFAEGWNKRATSYYLRGNFKSSVADIKRTLELEKRHFGALSGLGLIYTAMGDDRLALKAYEAVREINPYQPGLEERVNELRAKTGMRRT